MFSTFVDELVQLIDSASVSGLDKPQLDYNDLLLGIDSLRAIDVPQSVGFSVEVVGKSYLGQDIHLLRLGNGPIRLFAWSQMHGNEPTATAALFDLLQLLLTNSHTQWMAAFLEQISLYVLPMLNPDGANFSTRENAQGIDINRDAFVLQSPEGRLLRQMMDQIEPEYAFNLHDQSRFYAAGDTLSPVVMAFLAPPGDQEMSNPPHREKAKKLIAGIVSQLQNYVPGKITRYVDEYSVRAFGDFATRAGIATILIESGRDYDDPNRQTARKLNVIALLSAMDQIIAAPQFSSVNASHINYEDIPYNRENGFCDVLIRNLALGEKDQQYRVDVAIRKILNGEAVVSEIGDLAAVGGYAEIDASKLHIKAGKSYAVTQHLQLTTTTHRALLKQGYTHFCGNPELISHCSKLPLLFGVPPTPDKVISLGIAPTFLLSDGNDVNAVILAGELITLGHC